MVLHPAIFCATDGMQTLIAFLAGKPVDMDLFQPQECADLMEKSMIVYLTIIKKQEMSSTTDEQLKAFET